MTVKVLVTGASGFFGSALVPLLVNTGHEVTTFGRSPAIEAFAKLNVKHSRGDLSDVSSLQNAFRGQDAVIHMAGLVSYRRCDYDRLYQSNVIGTRNVMQAALDEKIQRIIHMSSIAGMGMPEPGQIADETLEYNLQGRGLHYCDTKHLAELEALKFSKAGLPVLVLSPGITFGEGDTHPHHHTIFNSMARGASFGHPRGGVMFSDIQDVAATTVSALTKGTAGENYVIGSENMTFLAAAVALSKLTGSRPPVFPIPGALSELAGFVCESVAAVTGQTPRLTRQVAWLSQRNIFFSSDKATTQLGHYQRPFADTIERTAPFYMKGYVAAQRKSSVVT